MKKRLYFRLDCNQREKVSTNEEKVEEHGRDKEKEKEE